MQQLRRNSVSRIVAYILVVAVLTPQCLVYLPSADAQGAQNVPAVAVIPFQDLTGQATPALMREVTSAAALALEDRKEYIVTSTVDLDREMQALRMTPPLSQAEQARLGARLHVEKVLVGSLASLAVDSASGRARVVLRLQLLDVGIGEYLDGAVVQIETKAIPGFSGDIAQVTNEAIRQAAEAAVEQMLAATVRRGSVELVDDQGNINVNLGTDDGLEVGSELLVMRPTWQPDVEQVVMRRVGTVRVSDPGPGMSIARRVEGSIPTTGDRVYRLYKPFAVMAAESKSRKIKKSGQMLAGILLLVGLVGIGGGSTTASPSTLSCFMGQQRPGDTPTMELRISTSSTARSTTHAYLMYRAANNPNFSPTAATLIGFDDNPRLTRWSDNPLDFIVAEDITFEFTFADDEGEPEDGSVDLTYIDAPLVQGNRYFYRVRRVVDPLLDPGANPPIGSAQVELPEPSIEVDPVDALSEPSTACGPITFFLPPVLGSTPAAGAANLPTENISFTWQSTVGANEYQVEVFPASDPDGLNSPILQSSVIRTTGTTSTPMNASIRGPFSAQTTYWWRVGARQSSDPKKPVNLQTNREGWLYSEMRNFSTTLTPPPPPGSAGTAQPTPIPPRSGGWHGAGRSGRR